MIIDFKNQRGMRTIYRQGKFYGYDVFFCRNYDSSNKLIGSYMLFF